jgi:hypothetical protein
VGRDELPATLAGREAPPARRSALRWAPVALLAAAAAYLLVLVVGTAVPDGPASMDTALVATAAPTTAAPGPAAPSTTAPDPTTVDPASPLENSLAALHGRLPTGIALRAPTAWARWAGRTPSYARDIDGCPHIATKLAAALGGRWTYVYGTLPQSACNWFPVPWNPNRPVTQRFYVTIEFQQGVVADLLRRTNYCAGGAPAPTVDASDAAAGAVLSGCDDAESASVQLALPDVGGTGVWFLGATSGVEQTALAPPEGLLALIGAAGAVYH